jgi:hypothetical protein
MKRKPEIGDKIKILKDVSGVDESDNLDPYLKKDMVVIIDSVTEDNQSCYIGFKDFMTRFNFDFFIREEYFEFIEDTKTTLDTQQKIDRLFFNFSEFLKEKNKRYGDSVINPVKIFSKVEPSNKACIRLDEKLQRIINNDIGELRKNDVADTFGYIALLMIDKGWLNFEEMID